VIGIGTRLTDFTTGSKALFSHPDVEFLLLNVAEFDALKLDATALIADAQTGLQALTHALGIIAAAGERRSPRRNPRGATSAVACGIASGILLMRPKWQGTWIASWWNTAKRSTLA
jgi:hypothetical protein